MNKLIVLLLMCLVVPAAQAAINPATGVEFAVENAAVATDILSHKTRKARLAAATEYWKKSWQPYCKYENGKPFPTTTSESDGVITILCDEQELSQIELIESSDFENIYERRLKADAFTEWYPVKPMHELTMYWPQLLSKEFRDKLKD